EGLSPDDAEQVIVAFTQEMQRRGKWQPDSPRQFRIWVKVSVGPAEPPRIGEPQFDWVVPWVIDWAVYEGEEKLGTVQQMNRVWRGFARSDVWAHFVRQGVPAAVPGVLKLTEER